MPMPIASAMPEELNGLLAQAETVGFHGLMYGVDALDGEVDPPIEMLSYGVSPAFVEGYLGRLREDPLRRMVARGEISVGNIPIVVENDGQSLSIAQDRRLSAGDRSLLRWVLAQGHRTGISFRIPMRQGRVASLNFYSAFSHTKAELEAATRCVFLMGHQLHAALQPRLSARRDNLLSGREAECLEWIALGKSNGEIAMLLGLSTETVKEHVQGLFQKLKVNGRAQAVARGHMLAYLG